MSIRIEGPVEIHPIKEPDPPPEQSGHEAVLVFIGLVALIGLVMALWK
jgi:hypothetical protein